MKTILLTLALLVAPMMAQAADGQETAYQRVMRTGTIKCGYTPWPMYFDLDPVTKELTGADKEMSDATAKLLGLKIEYIEVQFANKVIDLQSGKVDVLCGDGPWILTSIKQQDYTVPYTYIPVYPYVRANETRLKSRDDLNKPDVTFVGIDGDTSVELVQNYFPQAKLTSLVTNADASQMLLDVSTNKADVTVLDPAAATNFIKNNPGKVKPLTTKALAVYNVGFGVKKGEVDLLNMLNSAVMALRNTGGTDPILDKYDPKHEKFLRVQPDYISK